MERHGWGFGAYAVAIIFLFSTFAGASVQPDPAVLYVDASAAGANTGANWADAFTDLQLALDAAVAGDEIWVAAGTYKPTKMTGGTGERFKAYQLKNDVGVFGGFNGTETDKSQRNWDANPTILSGDLNGDDNDVILPTEPTRQDNCYHVFNHPAGTNLTASAVLDGFVVTGGNGTDSQAFGGGMFNDGSSPTISHCTFRANSASVVSDSGFFLSGGAILNYHLSSPTISHCVFTENYGWYGGGICNIYSSNPTINDCAFNQNTAVWGGGICNPHAYALSGSKPVISRCTFQDNTATVGGGIFNGYYTQMVITGCTFSNNSSDSMGGGIHNGNDTSLTITTCIFDRNIASSHGGGVYGSSFTLSMTNCIFSQNSSSQLGGGLCITMAMPSNILIANSTFSGNSSGSSGGGISIDSGYTLNNCIVWGNTAGTPHSKQITFITGMSVNYCNIQGQVASGPGNISADPLFVDAANGDLRLQAGSPCIDAGTNAAIPDGITTDLAGNPRIVDGNSDSNAIVDMGAFEYTINERVAAPVIQPAGGTYNAEQNVTMTCATAGAMIRYTLDGNDPNNGMIYEAGTAIPVEQSLTLRAVGLNAYMIPSEGAVAAYRLVVATPTFTPDYGRYLTDQAVQIACATPGATIYYTTDGSDPAQSGTIIENGGTVTVSVNPATTLKAIAFKGNMEPSAIKTASYAQSHIIYVNAAATGANNGKTWANAFTRLQYALDDLSDYSAKPGDEIWVAAGTYKPTKAVGGTELQFRTFQMKRNVGIYGGFNGTETSRDQRDWVVNRTILSGDLYGNDVRTPAGPLPWGNRGENCYHVVKSMGYYLDTSVLDGFTITGGNAVGRDDFNGGGMYNFGSTITVRHCIFTANTTMSGMSGSGGGMYNSNSSPLIMDCVFVNNYSRRGGGMANVSGSNPTLIDCVFSDNIAAGSIEQDPSKGGAMHNWSSCSPIITNCIFNGNSSVLGGAVYNYSSSRPVFTNCLLMANLAASAGGALFNMAQSSPTMANCILWDNTAPTGPVMYSDSSDPIITYSNIEGGWTGEGNIDGDPLFVDAANRDLRLQAGSPCIDKGSNDAIPMGVAADLDGTPRIVDGNCDAIAVVDMGAYEYFLPGDLNTTCSVNVEDLSLFSPYWLAVDCTSPDNCGQADIDRNGVVDLSDFAILAGHWMKGI